jgi:hypothetical protein
MSLCDACAIIPLERRLVPTEREAVRVPPVDPQKRAALPGREVEEGLIHRHVVPAGAPRRVEEERPPHVGYDP